jgi:DNA-directed RNA polymerase subunit F
MVIKNIKSMSMAESLDIIEDIDIDVEKKKEIKGFIKKFIEINPKDAKKLRGEIEELNLIKIKEEHIVNIIDFLLETASDLNKIFVDVSLNEDETNKILEIIKKHR